MTLSTHVLDANSGRPAANVALTLHRRAETGTWVPVGEGVTDDDGRCSTLAPKGLLVAVYRLHFDTGASLCGNRAEGFLPRGVHRLRGDRAHAAPSRATAVVSVRLFHLPRELTMGVKLGWNQYGKAENRVVRVFRDSDPHEIVDYNVSVALSGGQEARISPATTHQRCRPTHRRTLCTPSRRRMTWWPSRSRSAFA